MPKRKYYGVAYGRNTGIFETWEECKQQIDGFSGAIFKSFSTIEECKQFVQSNKKEAPKEKEILKVQTKPSKFSKFEKKNLDTNEFPTTVDFSSLKDTFDEIEIFIDGSCIPNPGPGGWAALFVLKKDSKEVVRKTLLNGEHSTTNNKMELLGAIHALEAIESVIKQTSIRVQVTTDSQYVKHGITEWIPIWKKKNWKTWTNKQVLNKDLWERLDQVHESLKGNIVWNWVKGHSGHPENGIHHLLYNHSYD